jgi:hypothetical protein
MSASQSRAPVHSGRKIHARWAVGTVQGLRRRAKLCYMTVVILGLVGPVLGIIGVFVGIWYGQKRWLRDRADRQSDFFITKQREAYIELFNAAQEAHMGMRESLVHEFEPVFSSVLKNVNTFIWKHGIYVLEEDRTLVQDYLVHVYDFLRLVAECVIPGVKEMVALTAAPIGPPVSAVREMQRAEQKASALYDRLVERIRTVLGAPTIVPLQMNPTDFTADPDFWKFFLHLAGEGDAESS